MPAPQITFGVSAVLAFLIADMALSQQWTVENDEDENFTLYLKRTDDPSARRVPIQLPKGQPTTISFTPQIRYHLMLRSSGGLTYRTTRPISLDGREYTPLSRIVSPVKNKNGTVKRNRNGHIIYQVMNQDGFDQDEDYEELVQRLSRSSWSTKYEAVGDKHIVSAGLSIEADRGAYAGRNGQLSDVAYAPDEDNETITIDGVWRWGGGAAKGRFYFTINFNQPNEFKGEYWKDDDPTRYSWTGSRN